MIPLEPNAAQINPRNAPGIHGTLLGPIALLNVFAPLASETDRALVPAQPCLAPRTIILVVGSIVVWVIIIRISSCCCSQLVIINDESFPYVTTD